MRAGALKPVARTSVVDHIVEQIKGLLRDKEVGPGSRLPTERELAQRFGVSRPTVREALRTLSMMGVIDKHHGSGTQIVESSDEILRQPFEFLFMLEQTPLRELHEARSVLELDLAARAAERRTARDLEALRAALHDLERGVKDRAIWPDANVRFHQAIAAAGHNRILERIMTTLHQGMRASIRKTERVLRDLRPAYQAHLEVFRAIERGKPDEAREAMVRHMKLGRDHLERLGSAGD